MERGFLGGRRPLDGIGNVPSGARISSCRMQSIAASRSRRLRDSITGRQAPKRFPPTHPGRRNTLRARAKSLVRSLTRYVDLVDKKEASCRWKLRSLSQPNDPDRETFLISVVTVGTIL